MCSHYLVDPVACTPASGWEKGQVEYQVGLVRERFFTPRLRFKTYEEMNTWLLDKCIAYAKVHRHPELTEQTIWEVFEAERPKLVPYAGRFDGFHAVPASVSKTCLCPASRLGLGQCAGNVARLLVDAARDLALWGLRTAFEVPRSGVRQGLVPHWISDCPRWR
jgi:hypothetical protein